MENGVIIQSSKKIAKETVLLRHTGKELDKLTPPGNSVALW